MQYSYLARDQKGAFVKGMVEANDREGATEAISGRGLIPVKIGEQGKGLSMQLSFRRGVPLLEKVMFARQLSTMVSAGLPLAQSLHILASQSKNKKMQDVISDLAKDVEGGMSFSGALSKHPSIFNQVTVSMVKAGETGGILDQVLDGLATQLEREHSTVGKIRGAMIYPSVIFGALIVMFILMMTMVIPQLTNIFKQMNTQLPLNTHIVIWISDAFTKYWVITAVTTIILVIAVFRYVRTENGRHLWHRILLKLPVAGAMSTKLNLARFTSTLGSLMAGGIPVVESLNIVADTASNILFKEELLEVAKQVSNGVPISKALEPSPYYPLLVKQMIAVGEETGELDKILQKLAGFYEEEIDNMTKNLTSIIEPVLLIVIGVAVGFLVISIILPLYNMQPQ
jgi:type IV pilus assembly protein PilC